MRIAIIDCGTNTFNLLVADADRNGWNAIFQNKLAVKLGAGGFQQRHIIPSRFYRGMDAFYCHQQNILNFSCNKVFAFATSAIREADNGAEFAKRASAKFDIQIDVIDGDREAELIYSGITQTIQFGERPSLIMDIGGGSTEFIIADQSGILWKKSFLLGVSRLHELVKPSDRMKNEEVQTLNEMLAAQLKPLKDALEVHKVQWLVGSSGSFDTLFDLYVEGAKQQIQERGLSNEIPLHTFPGIHAWLMGSTFEQRLNHSVIPTIRAEYMPLASFLVNYVLTLAPFEKLYHSAYSLKEGAMMEIVKGIDWPEESIELPKTELE